MDKDNGLNIDHDEIKLPATSVEIFIRGKFWIQMITGAMIESDHPENVYITRIKKYYG